MRLLLLTLSFLGATACIGGGSLPDRETDDTDDSDSPVDTDTDTEVDTASGTDDDGDGFTVEEGDCNDADVFINPGWNEANARSSDGKDNDCDGRVDESFAGLMVVDVDTQGTDAPKLKQLDDFGILKGDVALTEPVDGFWSDETLEADGWIVLGGDGRIARVMPNGTVDRVLVLGDLTWPEDDPPPGFSGLVTHHNDDAYYISCGDRLLRLTWTGTEWDTTVAVEWLSSLSDETHEATVVALAADRFKERVALIGAGGAMGWFTPGSTTVDWRAAEDPDDPLFSFTMAHALDNKAMFVLGTELGTETTGIWRWSETDEVWKIRGEWPNVEDYPPHAFTIEDETGDFYVTVNSGWSQMVWRMVADGTYTGQLFTTNDAFRMHRHRAPLVLWE